MQSLAGISLNALDNLEELGVDLLGGLHAADVGDDVLGLALGHDGGKLLGLIVLLDVLETEGHLDGVEEVLDVAAVLGNLGGGSDEALLAGELAEGGTADTLDGVLEMGVADALDDLVDIGGLGGLVDAVLGDDEALGLLKSATDLGHDGLVLEGVVDGALATVVAVVGGGGVRGVDGEELALDEGSQVLGPVDALDGGDADVLEGSLFDDPLKELLEGDVEASVGVLGGDNAVNGRVGVAGARGVVLEAVGGCVFRSLDELGEGVRGADGVFAGNDGEGLERSITAVDALGDDGGDELEDAGADGAGDDVGGGNLVDQVGLVGLGVDGAVVCDFGLGGALDANLDDAIRGGGVDGVDEGIGDVGKDDVIARVMEEAGDKATAWGVLALNEEPWHEVDFGGDFGGGGFGGETAAMTCSGGRYRSGEAGVAPPLAPLRGYKVREGTRHYIPILPAPK